MIAIENARLLTELRESLDRQTATAEICKVISVAGDSGRALDTIAETAVRMFGASNVGIRRVEDGDSYCQRGRAGRGRDPQRASRPGDRSGGRCRSLCP